MIHLLSRWFTRDYILFPPKSVLQLRDLPCRHRHRRWISLLLELVSYATHLVVERTGLKLMIIRSLKSRHYLQSLNIETQSL